MGLHNARRIAYLSVQRAKKNFGSDTYVGTFQFRKVYCGKFRFGPCYLDDINGKDFVVKLYDDPKAKPGVIERRLRDELDLLDIHEGEHPGFVKLLAFFWEDEKVGVVYEIDAIDSLQNLVTKDSFTWPQRVKAAVSCRFSVRLRTSSSATSITPCLFMQEKGIRNLQAHGRHKDATEGNGHVIIKDERAFGGSFPSLFHHLFPLPGFSLFLSHPSLPSRAIGCAQRWGIRASFR